MFFTRGYFRVSIDDCKFTKPAYYPLVSIDLDGPDNANIELTSTVPIATLASKVRTTTKMIASKTTKSKTPLDNSFIKFNKTSTKLPNIFGKITVFL